MDSCVPAMRHTQLGSWSLRRQRHLSTRGRRDAKSSTRQQKMIGSQIGDPEGDEDRSQQCVLIKSGTSGATTQNAVSCSARLYLTITSMHHPYRPTP